MSATKLLFVHDLDWATRTNRWSLKVCGIWREKHYSRFRNAFSNLMAPAYALFISFFGLVPQALALVKVWGDVTLMTENLILSVPFVVTLCKIVAVWFKKEVIIMMMNFIKEDWNKPRNEVEREIMIKYAQVSRTITFGGYSVITASVLVYNSPVIFGFVLRTLTNLTDTGSRPLVLQSIYLIDVYQTPIYQLTVISQALSCSLTGFCYTTVGALFGVIVLHVCSQLENLNIRMESMMKNVRVNRKNIQEVLRSNVREHQRLIRFVDTIESTFSIMLLMIVPALTIMLCVQGFQLISAFGHDGDIPIMQVGFGIVFMTYVAFVMFVYSSVGQVLITQSTEIQDAVYECEWYNLKPREAAQLIMILIRAQRPLMITAGKFFPLSISTFTTLLKTTSGYLSCLLAVQD